MGFNETIFFQPSSPLEEADICIIGVPFDGTVSGRSGSRSGPQAIREATKGIEDYSPFQDRDITECTIHDAGDMILPIGDTNACLDLIYRSYAELACSGKKCVALGGEHLISWPLVRFQHERCGSDLLVIQFDAHADRREDYLGVTFSHATVMQHIGSLIGYENVASLGIRSGTKEEWDQLRSEPHVYGGLSSKPLGDFADFAGQIHDRPVYITVDPDVFDPGLLSGTGTPEPGGISYKDFLEIVGMLKKANIIGADIVELSPDYDTSGVSSFVAGGVLRELILLMK